jgi:hypothetical protein
VFWRRPCGGIKIVLKAEISTRSGEIDESLSKRKIPCRWCSSASDEEMCVIGSMLDIAKTMRYPSSFFFLSFFFSFFFYLVQYEEIIIS